jgi:hypothetical protein
MSSRFSLIFVLGLVACSPSRKLDITFIPPVTSLESQAIQVSLIHGTSIFRAGAETEAEPDPCKAFQESLPENFTRGFLTVPENWDQPKGRQIKVFYYGNLTSKPGAGAPVIFYNGGPGSDSHGSYESLHESAKNHGLSFIYLDQRGTGCSDPYPIKANHETAQRLTRYGTRSIVLDSEALRRHLFPSGEKWKIFGQSYGGAIVHRYTGLAPEGVVAAYAHGFSVMKDPMEWLKLRLLSQKRVLADYLKVYPDDLEIIKKLREAIPAEKCFTDGDLSVCGNSVIDAATILLGFKTSWETLNGFLSAMITPDGQVDEEVFTSYLAFMAITTSPPT